MEKSRMHAFQNSLPYRLLGVNEGIFLMPSSVSSLCANHSEPEISNFLTRFCCWWNWGRACADKDGWKSSGYEP